MSVCRKSCQPPSAMPNVFATGCVFFNGKRIARRDLPAGDVKYYFADHLGSASVVSSATGDLLEEYDYGPFGELHWQASQTPQACYNVWNMVVPCQIFGAGSHPMMAPGDTNHYLFTGKERNTETGLDYSRFRYYGSNMGRWMSPDPAGMMAVDIGSPQTLNRYSYVNNNPLSFTDPLGLDCVYLTNSGKGVESIDQHGTSGECGKTGGYWVNGAVTDAKIDADNGIVNLTGTTNGKDNNTSATYRDTTADVSWTKNTATNPFGHISIGVGGGTSWGLNPKSDLRFLFSALFDFSSEPVPGKVSPQVGGQLVKLVRIPVTGMQADMIRQSLQQSQSMPPGYTDHPACGVDCTGFAQQILGDAGINSGPRVEYPKELIQQLEDRYPQ